MTKIVFLGAGSFCFGLSMLRDLAVTASLAGATLVLVTRRRESAARAAALARFLCARTGMNLTVESTIDRRAALDGAHFVVNATAIERNRLWKRDFELPKKYGIRHTLGENGGPGALSFTLRTLPMIFDFVRDMEELCPRALFINFSNPESRIVLAVNRYSRIRCIGLCEGLYGARDQVAKIIGLPAEEVEVRGAGLNHFQCLLHIRRRATGEDLYPRLREAEPRFDPSFLPLTRRLLRAFGYWLTCSDEHLGEHLAYGYEAGEHGYDFAADERAREAHARTVQDVLSGAVAAPSWWREPSGENGAAVIAAMARNERRLLDSAVVCNGGVIPNLPHDLAVEMPVMVDAAGVHPLSLGALPDSVAKLMAMAAHVQQLAVEAAMRASKELALQALLIDPVVNSSTAAFELIDALWDLNRPYIRPCISSEVETGSREENASK